MARRTEKSVVSEIKKVFNSLDKCFIRKRKPYVRGDPDLTGSYHGKRIEIEAKTKGGVVAPLQEKRVRDWKELGCIAGFAWDLEDAIEVIWDFLTEEDKDLLRQYRMKVPLCERK